MAMDSEEGASITSSVLNLLNNVVGAGLFSLPWCLKESTVITGSILVSFMCMMNISSFMLLADSCDLTSKYSYLELGRLAFGQLFGTIAQITTICYAAGSLISYSVLAGDCLAGKGTGILSLFFGTGSVLGDGSLTARAISTFTISLVFFLPLSLMRRIDSLKYASIFAFAATLFAGFLVAYEFIDNPPNSREDDSNDEALSSSVVWIGFPLGVWEAVPIVNVAFTAHYNGPRFYEELSQRNLSRFHMVVMTALGGALLIYLSVGVCGYLTFGDETLGDVLSNFSPTYKLAVGTRAALLVILVAVFPKALHSMRDGLIRLNYEKPVEGEVVVQITGDTLPLKPYVAITCMIVFTAATLGAVCTQVEVVLAYKGGIFGTMMVYLLPPLMRTAIAEQTLSQLKYGRLAGAPSTDSRGRITPKVPTGLRGKDLSEVAAQSPLTAGLTEVPHAENRGMNHGTNHYLNVAQQDASVHSNFTVESASLKQSDFLFDDELRSTSTKDSMRSNRVNSSEKLLNGLIPGGVFDVVKTMYTNKQHWKCAFIFTWGVCSGLLSVCITILKQSGVLKS